MTLSTANNRVVPALLEVHRLSIDFWSQHRWMNVVNNISFSVKPGESVGLVGESGCGKTTTAYTLIGYRRPNSRIREGEIRFGGQNLLQLAPSALQQIRGRRISLVPQNPTTALSPGMRVGEQLLEVLVAHGIRNSMAERRERVADLLTQVRLPEPERIAQRFPHQLSGGQQQRVVIAMALACNPDLLVLDEPTTGLDVTTQAQILELLNTLRAEHGMAMVYVTHDLGVIALICDRVGVMYAGELVEDAPTAEIFRNPRHPYTRGLIASVPSVHAPMRRRSGLLRGYLQREQLPSGCHFAPRCDFARDKCFSDQQRLEPVAVDHHVACWRWKEVTIPPQTNLAKLIDAPLASADDALLRVEHIDCAYEFSRTHPFARGQAKLVVRDVSFEIKVGQTVALVGESGSGKSTIARAIAGLLVPTAGRITFEGKDVLRTVGARNQDQRREIQLIFQNPDASLNPRQQVLEIVGQPLRIFFDMTGAAKRQRVEQLLEDVRLDSSYVRRYPDELSGGERQRIAIARALAARPKLVLCDEILSALDVSVQSGIIDLLRVLQAEHQIAFLFISHDLTVVRSLAQRVGVLYRGQLCETGLVEEVFSPPYHPYTHMLFSAVPDIDGRAKSIPLVRDDAEPNTSKKATACPFADRCPWKIGSICDDVSPPWQATSSTHALRCHIPLSELQEREIWSAQPDKTQINLTEE